VGSFVLRSSHTRIALALGIALALPACIDLGRPLSVTTDGGAGDLLAPSGDTAGALDGLDGGPVAPPIRSGLRGDFYTGLDFENYTGTYFDAVVDFDEQATAKMGAARTGRPADFSARWTGEVHSVTDGAHVFVVRADDGVRLWIGDTLLIDDWAGGSRVREGTFTMIKDQRYPIKLEYFQTGNSGNCALRWRVPGAAERVISSGNLRNTTLRAGMPGLRAEFFSDATLTTVSGIFHDTRISFSEQEAPVFARARTGSDINYSARWTGELLADFSEDYTFEITVDDGARVWLDDILIVAPPSGASRISRGTTPLKEGQWYRLRVEFSQTFGPSSMVLRWVAPSLVLTVVPPDRLRYPSDDG